MVDEVLGSDEDSWDENDFREGNEEKAKARIREMQPPKIGMMSPRNPIAVSTFGEKQEFNFELDIQKKNESEGQKDNSD